MEKRKTIFLLLTWNIFVIFLKNVDAGPVKRSSRMVREIYPEIEPENDRNQAQVCIVGDVVYGLDEPVPADQPCLKCRCQPPGVQCETIRCIKKPGCKAIHRPNKCCPDYQCECQHEGKSYANGERLKSPPGGECKVCYCRGGEVQCADVSCYIRTDCEAKTVPGQCCPKYDHCPPKEPLLLERPYTSEIFQSPKTINEKVLELWPITAIAPNLTFVESNENTSPSSPITPTYDIQDENKITFDNKESVVTEVRATEFTEGTRKQIEQPRITIQEIIPEVKEIPITAPSPPLPNQADLIIEEAEIISANNPNNNNDLVVTDSDDTETDSSELSEIFQQPPPVLRIGDKLLFLKKGTNSELVSEKDSNSTPTSVITIIGAEGLQRGFEDGAGSGEVHEIKIGDTNQTIITSQEIDASNSTMGSNDFELKASESTHILSLVKQKNQKTVTELPIIFTTILDNSTELLLAENETLSSDNGDLGLITADSAETLTEPTTEILFLANVTEVGESLNNSTTPRSAVIGKNSTISGDEEETTNSVRNITNIKILPTILDIRNNKTIPKNNNTNSEWLKSDEKHTVLGSVLNPEAVLPFDLLNETAPTDFIENVEPENSKTTTEADDNSTVTTETPTTVTFNDEKNIERSVESVEGTEEESGEMTTTRTSHASIKSNENASIEPDDSNYDELTDMLTSSKEIIDKETNTSLLNQPQILVEDVELINNSIPNKTVEKSTTPTAPVEDVEIVDQSSELNSAGVTAAIKEKSIGKRENSAQDEDDEVFKQLNAELNDEHTERILTKEEEDRESDKIFKELLEETSGTITTTVKSTDKAQNRETEALQRVSDALAKFTLKGRKSSLDSSILGILTDFFSSQYKYYNEKEK